MPIFEISKSNYGEMAINIAIFCDLCSKWHYILVEFKSDRMSPRESAENRRICAYGFNCKILSILSSYSKSRIKLHYAKKFLVSPTIFKFSPLTPGLQAKSNSVGCNLGQNKPLEAFLHLSRFWIRFGDPIFGRWKRERVIE